MISRIIKNIETTYEAIENLRVFFTSVINGEFKNRDAEINKRFQQFENQKHPSPQTFNPKMESMMDHSQGVSGFVAKAHADKIIHNRGRH